jgi:hypothetical protein
LFSRLGSDDKVFGTIGKPEEVKDRYAVTKLELWNVVFNNMERQGQMIHMKLSEVQCDVLGRWGSWAAVEAVLSRNGGAVYVLKCDYVEPGRKAWE